MFDIAWGAPQHRQAAEEHWDIFLVDAEEEYPEIEFFYDDPGPWATDDEVITHCAVMSIFGGSNLHALALQIEYLSHRAHYDGEAPYAKAAA
jgi:hypothetical protein